MLYSTTSPPLAAKIRCLKVGTLLGDYGALMWQPFVSKATANLLILGISCTNWRLSETSRSHKPPRLRTSASVTQTALSRLPATTRVTIPHPHRWWTAHARS